MSEAALRDRIEYLEADNANLRRRLALLPKEQFIVEARCRLKIQPGEARLLWVLSSGRAFSHQSIHEALYGDEIDQPEPRIIAVYLSRLRKALRPHGIEVESIKAFGFRLDPTNRAKVWAALGLEPQP